MQGRPIEIPMQSERDDAVVSWYSSRHIRLNVY